MGAFENPPVCENDSSYKFNLKRVQKEVDCLWISKNKKRKEKRRAKYCFEEFDNGALVAACKKSCTEQEVSFHSILMSKKVSKEKNQVSSVVRVEINYLLLFYFHID